MSIRKPKPTFAQKLKARADVLRKKSEEARKERKTEFDDMRKNLNYTLAWMADRCIHLIDFISQFEKSYAYWHDNMSLDYGKTNTPATKYIKLSQGQQVVRFVIEENEGKHDVYFEFLEGGVRCGNLAKQCEMAKWARALLEKNEEDIIAGVEKKHIDAILSEDTAADSTYHMR